MGKAGIGHIGEVAEVVAAEHLCRRPRDDVEAGRSIVGMDDEAAHVLA